MEAATDEVRSGFAPPFVMRREEGRCKRLEAEAHHLRSSAEATAATAKEVLGQLELTRSAVEGTQAAARKIVDDHERDVSLLMGELRSLVAPESAAAIESRLSASLEALSARKRHAAVAKRQPTGGNLKRSMSFDRFSRAATEAVAGVTDAIARAGSPFRAASPFRGRGRR